MQHMSRTGTSGQHFPGLKIVILAVLLTTPQFIAGAKMMKNDVITQAEIQHLPQPVQRFLEYSGVMGTPRITQATIEQTGFFKIAPDKPWKPFTATQVYNIPGASFEWKVRMKMAPFIIVTGRDALQDGQGSMKIKLFGLIPLVNAKGPEMDQGAMTRYLSETIWFPQAFLDEHITWEELDSLSARATLTIEEKSVTGVFHFDTSGKFKEFTCNRYYVKGDEKLLLPWRAPGDDYANLGGLQLTHKGRAIWDHPEGDYTYIKLEISRVDYE